MDFNLWEITALVVLAIIVFGPEKLPELARKAARVLQYLRRIGNDARGQLRKELGDEFADISLADLNPRAFVAKHLLSGEELEDLRQIREEAIASGTIVRDTLEDAKGSASDRVTDDATDGAPDSATDSAHDPAAREGGSTASEVWEESLEPAILGHVPFDPEAT